MTIKRVKIYELADNKYVYDFLLINNKRKKISY